MRASVAIASLLLGSMACDVPAPPPPAGNGGTATTEIGSSPPGFRLTPELSDFDVWSVGEVSPPVRAEAMDVHASGVVAAGAADRLERFDDVIQEIRYHDEFDLERITREIKESLPRCYVPRIAPRTFRRPVGGGHSRDWVDPSRILGFTFDPRQCTQAADDPRTEFCKIAKRWVDPTGHRAALRIALTPRTAPFRALFADVADELNRAARRLRIVGDRQEFVSLLPGERPYGVDCDANAFDFAHPIAAPGPGGAPIFYDGHSISVRHLKTWAILDSDIFIDPRALVDADLERDRFLLALRRYFAHEVLHALGFAHNFSSVTESIMNYYAVRDPRNYSSHLTPYDHAVLEYIYSERDDPALLQETLADGSKRFWDLKRTAS